MSEALHIGGYELESPYLNAGGLVRTVEEAEQMAVTAVAAVVGGSYTLLRRPGLGPNGETTYYHDPVTGETDNAIGMPNKPFEEVAEDLPAIIAATHKYNKPFVLNFAPVTSDPVQELITMSDILVNAGITELDGFELNASCPNVELEKGGRLGILSHHPVLLGAALFELCDISADTVNFKTLMARISPFPNKRNASDIVEAAQDSDLDIITAFNTFPNGRPLDANRQPILQVPGGVGGRSGRAMQLAAEEQTRWLVEARTAAEATFKIIGSNAIYDGKSLKRRLDIGVDAGSGTTIFWEEDWGTAVDRLLREYDALTEESA